VACDREFVESALNKNEDMLGVLGETGAKAGELV